MNQLPNANSIRLAQPLQRHSAFTLIEMLAVIIILGLITSLGTWSVSNAADQSTIRTLADRWRIFDTNARLLAQRTGIMVRIEHDAAQPFFAARSQGLPNSTDAPLALNFSYGRISQIQSAEVHAAASALNTTSVLIDRHGRSQDYAVTSQLTDGTAPSVALTLNISGLTGLVREQPGRVDR